MDLISPCLLSKTDPRIEKGEIKVFSRTTGQGVNFPLDFDFFSTSLRNTRVWSL